MSHIINFSSRNFSRNISSLVEVISESLIGQFQNSDAVITPDAKIALDNPIDRMKIDAAVQELKKDKSIKSKTVILSNKKEVVLSVE